MIKKQRFAKFLAIALTSISLAACSTTSGNKTASYDGDIYDPLEPVNRATFAFNQGVDTVLIEPIARGYRAATPQFARTGVQNFLRNLRTPVNAGNQLLQGDIDGAATDLTRLVVNSTVGVGGLFDVAGKEGLEHEHEDFGQTMAVWGVGHGPYLVLPIIGPSSVRDSVGTLADAYVDPVRLYLFNTDQEGWHYARLGITVISVREELLDVLDDLEKNSIDYYATLRSSYMQHRDSMVRDGDQGYNTSPVIPDYDEEDDLSMYDTDDWTEYSRKENPQRSAQIAEASPKKKRLMPFSSMDSNEESKIAMTTKNSALQ